MNVIVKFAVYHRKDHPRWQTHYRVVCNTETQKMTYSIQYYNQDDHEWYNNSKNRYETIDLLYRSKEFQRLFKVYE